ncbi:hypothetical protein CI109_104303 [Kwoniella shandongensis]|uniref:Ser-Thr-rich glycosyl-phosphatidyl-inositol-anchored membrane family-domain-containing protein n=1 Tax=Kwoniella shandongensis TaxID=1734106 RepID=A0AAJ8LMB8_9TREE
MLARLIFVALGLITSAQAAITILYPASDTIWYKNNTVNLNWTTSTPDSDIYLFRVLLSNQDQSVLGGNHSIADSTNATADYVRVLLPQLQASKGYVVNFVNTTNEAQVLATSQAFEIADGEVTSTTASASATAATSQSVNIPNANTQTSSATSNPFATSSASSAPSSAASSYKLDSLTGVFVQSCLAIASVCVGMAVAL